MFFFTGPPKIWLSPNPFMKSHTLTFFSDFTISPGTLPNLGGASKKKHSVAVKVIADLPLRKSKIWAEWPFLTCHLAKLTNFGPKLMPKF